MDDQVTEAARAVQIWAYPLLFAQRVRVNFTQPLDPTGPRPATSAGAPVNTLGHQRRLSDPGLTVGVAPNVDTLYSVGWLDVRHHDFVLRLPPGTGRYTSVQLALPDTTTPMTVDAGRPGEQVTIHLTRGRESVERTRDVVHLRTSWRYVMVVVRTLVDATAEDLATVHRLQDEMTLERVQVAAPPPDTRDRRLAAFGRAEETRRPEAFALALRAALDDAAPGAMDAATARALERSHLGDDPLPPDLAPAAAEGLELGLGEIAAHVRVLGRTVDGWAVNEAGTDFGDDHLLRAAVAHSQIFVNPATEALYPVCEVDSRGEHLDGARHSYRLTFAASGLPAARAFWSLTAYHAEGLLVENALGRYAIGDRTPGLRPEPDGSLTIDIGATRPGSTANWLPVPAGRFRLMLRLYRPSSTTWTAPPVIAVRPAPRGDGPVAAAPGASTQAGGADPGASRSRRPSTSVAAK